MSKRYIVTGLNLLDRVVVDGGEPSPFQLGGSAVYGLSGMLFWTGDIEFASRAGEDFMPTYGAYLIKNGLSVDAIRTVSKQTPYCTMIYDRDGNYQPGGGFFTGNIADAERWRPTVIDIEPFVGPETRGLYISAPPPGRSAFWEGFFELQTKFGFKTMWEPNPPCTFPDCREATLELLKKVAMSSFNLKEGCRLLGASDEPELLRLLCGLGCELILLRVGARGMYTISGGRICFVPSAPLPPGAEVVDVTGCGNSSTAAAMVAWCESGDLAMTGIKANVSSSYVLRQSGPVPLVDEEMRREAQALAQRLYAQGAYRYID